MRAAQYSDNVMDWTTEVPFLTVAPIRALGSSEPPWPVGTRGPWHGGEAAHCLRAEADSAWSCTFTTRNIVISVVPHVASVEAEVIL
jgi:hypothetical protein